MAVQLFGTRVSPFVEKVARALQYKGLEFSMVPLKSPRDFSRWSPVTGKMPVIDIDGARTYDSTRIFRALDAHQPEPRLYSDDPALARRQAFLEDWSDESLYWYAMGLRWNPVNSAASAEQVLGSLPPLVRPIARLFLPRQIAASARAQGLARLPLEVLSEELARRLDELVELLGDKPYFFSDALGAPDLAIFSQLGVLRSGPTPQAARMIDQRKSLAEFYDRVDRATAPKRAGQESGRRAA